MDFWRTLMVLVRRWYVAVPAFAATLVLAGAAYTVAPVEYRSDAVLVLTTPLAGGTAAAHPDQPNPLTNPLLNFDQSLSLTASLVIQQLSSPDVAASLGVTPGGSTHYEVNNGTTNPELLQSGPFIFIEGTAASAQEAESITASVVAKAATVLAQRQGELNAPSSTRIRTQLVVAPMTGAPLQRSRMRAAAAVGALAAMLGLAATYAAESFATNRRRRRSPGTVELLDGHDPDLTSTPRDVPDSAAGRATGRPGSPPVTRAAPTSGRSLAGSGTSRRA